MCALIRQELPLAMFPAGHGWTGNGKGTFSDATGEAQLIVNIDRSFRIETNGAEEAAVATSPELDPVDLSGKHVAFHSEISFPDRMKTVKLRLASGNIATDFAEVTVWETDEDPIGLQGTFERQSFPTGAFAVTGSVNWAEIKHAQILVTDNKAGKMALYVAGIYAVPDPGQATITFAFDDSLESAYTMARPVLSKHRFPATEYVIVDTVGESSFLTLEQLYTLRDQHDWEIAGHAFTEAAHNEPSGYDSLEGEALEEEVDGLRHWLDEHGFRRSTFAYPKGAAGSEVRRLIKRDYGGGRSTGPGPETLPARDDYILRGQSIDGLLETATTLKAKIDAAVEEGAWMILTFHKLVPGAPAADTEFQLSAFEEVVEHIRTLQEEGNGIEVLTMADAMGAIPGSAPAGAGEGETFRETKVFTIPDEIHVPAGDIDFIPPFFISLGPTQTAKVIKVIHRLNSGTSATFKLQKNGSDLTGFTGIEAKPETQTTDPADQEIADGDRLAMVVTAVSGAPKNLTVAVVIEYTVS
jgi:peptidoglycan/xylan/chitin deacetylase (PgdA/CDA1 family)